MESWSTGSVEPERYVLEGELGRGGYGVVHAAMDRNLDRPVAIKVLRPGAEDFERSMQRFVRGSQLSSRLSHPNIVSVYDVGVWRGRVSMVMERVFGPSLKTVLRDRGALPWGEAVLLMEQILDAVAHAHEQGIVHRDLKPSNVIMDERTGRPRLTDFDLAKDLEGDSQLSAVGMVLGTPFYVAPEQIRRGSRIADERSDVFALGVMLYELIAGERPFRDKDNRKVFLKILREDPQPLEERVSGLPRRLVRLVRRALDRRPERRYADAGEMLAALRQIIEEERPERVPERRPRGRRRRPSRSSSRRRISTKQSNDTTPILVFSSVAGTLLVMLAVLLGG